MYVVALSGLFDRPKRKHIVTPKWVEDCVDEETLLDEDRALFVFRAIMLSTDYCCSVQAQVICCILPTRTMYYLLVLYITCQPVHTISGIRPPNHDLLVYACCLVLVQCYRFW